MRKFHNMSKRTEQIVRSDIFLVLVSTLILFFLQNLLLHLKREVLLLEQIESHKSENKYPLNPRALYAYHSPQLYHYLIQLLYQHSLSAINPKILLRKKVTLRKSILITNT